MSLRLACRLPVLTALLACTPSPAQDPAADAPAAARGTETQPVELGLVRWRRAAAWDAALAEAKAKDRPLLVLFQEVPG